MHEVERAERRAPRRGVSPYIVVLAMIVAIVGSLLFALVEHLPLREAHDRLAIEVAAANEGLSAAQERASDLEAERDALRARVTTAEDELLRLRTERDGLAGERDALAAEHADTAAAVAQLQAAQDDLQRQLEREIERGEILLRNEHGELGVSLDSGVMFASGEAELNEGGQAVLRRVAASLRSLEDRMIEVSGHTDSTPVVSERTERYPTNWELSTARATNVVRFLQDECDVRGERLLASGRAQYSPRADNRTPRGRRQNRRIELTIRRAPAR